MNDDERHALEAWTGKLVAALDLHDLDPDIDAILNLAGDAARAVVRPAAPVTTYLVGYAAGRAVGAGSDPAAAVERAVSTAVALADAG